MQDGLQTIYTLSFLTLLLGAGWGCLWHAESSRWAWCARCERNTKQSEAQSNMTVA